MRKTIYISIVIICTALTVSVYHHWQRSRRTRLIICDVGQGDAILLVSHTTQILIDAGPASNHVSDCLAKQLSPFDHNLEVFVATHADADHIGGAQSVSESYTIENLILPFGGSDQASTAYDQLMAVSRSNIVNHSEVLASNDTILAPPFEMHFLWPSQNLPVGLYDDNQRSYVIEVQYHDEYMLFMGDADSTVMEQLIRSGALRTNYNYFVVPHHGSKNSASATFYATIKPMHAYISSGQNNPYGHPHPLVLQLLQRYHVPYTLTADVGDIVIDLDNQ